ncbi:MAG: ATP-binding protein [Bacteroidales bacterium]|nr:ATP-binding protein [Bacteroidales bacterium]
MKNPFVTNGYAGAEYFCDREKETSMMVQLLCNENNLALISPRRVGKTDLIQHCFAQPEIKNSYHTFLIDIYATNSLSDFVRVFGTAVLEELRSKGRSVWEKFIQALTSIRSEISFDINGLPSWNIGLGAISNPSLTLEEIFRYLEQADLPCLVAIDEFQQITYYNDTKDMEAILRTYIQRCTNTHFIFSGSRRHLMNEIFASPSRPFYQSVTIINLPAIALDKYIAFATEKFQAAEKSVDAEVITDLYQRFNRTTSCLQRVMNILFMKTPVNGHCSIEMVEPAINDLLDFSSDSYESILYQMPEKQRTVFLAIAAEGEAKNISGSAFVKKYKLISSSSVLSAVKGLLEKDFITVNQGVYSVYDLFFALWLKKRIS